MYDRDEITALVETLESYARQTPEWNSPIKVTFHVAAGPITSVPGFNHTAASCGMRMFSPHLGENQHVASFVDEVNIDLGRLREAYPNISQYGIAIQWKTPHAVYYAKVVQ